MSGEDVPGCLIVLVDESVAMDSVVQDGKSGAIGVQPKRKSEAVASTLNSLIRQLTLAADFDVALVGYHSDQDGNSSARSGWDGALQNRDFVPLSELAKNPLTVEKRSRKIPDPASMTGFREEQIDFPVWYVPKCSGSACQVKAFQRCKELLVEWQGNRASGNVRPLILHIFAANSSDGNTFKVIDELQKMPCKPLVFQAHLCASEHVPAALYVASRTYVPAGPIRDLFDRCSVLTPNLVSFLKTSKIAVGPAARGLVYNGRMIDIVQFLSLAKEHTKDWKKAAAVTSAPAVAAAPPAAAKPAAVSAPVATPSVPTPVAPIAAPINVATPESPVEPPVSDTPEVPSSPPDAEAPLIDLGALEPDPLDSLDNVQALDTTGESEQGYAVQSASGGTEKAACILFILDRSVSDPFAGDTQSSWSRLQEHANQLLAKIAKVSDGTIETGIISYGLDLLGEGEIRQTFEGPLSGKTLVSQGDLAAGAIRIDEVQQQEPDGVGGLMTITVKKKVFVELEPTDYHWPLPAFTAGQEILAKWCSEHPDACVPPIVLHLTRGKHDGRYFDGSSWDELRSLKTAAGSVRAYHLVATEEPHSTIAFPIDDSGLQTEELKELFKQSSQVLGGEGLEAKKPKLIKANSHGLVVNGKFDFLLDGIQEAFAKI